MPGSDLLLLGLTAAGAAAVCAAAGGALAAAVRWSGARMGMAVGAGALAGAVVGAATLAAPSLTDLATVLPRIGQAADAADMARVLKTYYPGDYGEAETALEALQSSQAQTESALRAIGYPLMVRQIALASTDNTVAYLELTRDETAVLAQNPEVCGRVLDNPGPDAMESAAQVLPDELKARETRLQIQILEQTAVRPQPPRPTQLINDQISLLGRDAVWGLSFDERDALRGSGEAHGAAECKAFQTMLRVVSFNSPAIEAELFKAMLAKGAQGLQSEAAGPAPS